MSEPPIPEPGTIIYRETGMPRFVRVAKGRRAQEEEELEEDIEEEEFEDQDVEEEVQEGEEIEIELEEDEIARHLEDDEREMEEIPKEVIEEIEEKGIPKYEEIFDLIDTKQELPTALKEFAKMYSLPTYEMKLLPQKIKRRIYRYQVVYPAIERLKVGDDGKLLPIVVTPNKIRYMDDISSTKRSKPVKGYSPEKTIQPNPFNAALTIGAYVTFIPSNQSGEIEEGEFRDDKPRAGPIIAFDRQSITVSVKEDGKIVLYIVDYKNPTIKVTEPPKRGVEEVRRSMPDIREQQEVPPQIRAIMVDTYVELIQRLIAGDAKGEKEVLTEKSGSQIIREMSTSPVVPWDDYYATEFEKWTRAKYIDKIHQSLDTNKIMDEAQRLAASAVDEKNLIEDIFEGITVDENLTISGMLDQLNKLKEITAIQASTTQALNQEVLSGYGHWKGTSLAAIINNVIAVWKRFYPTTVDDVYKMLIETYIAAAIDDYEPSDDDRKEFEVQNLASIKKLYDEYVSKRLQETSPKGEPSVIQTVVASVVTPKLDFSLKSTTGGIRAKVEMFERTIMGASSSLYPYMLKMVTPYIFLAGPLAGHAKFFQEKLIKGKFDISLLGEANLAHFLPELTMNTKLTDDQWKLIFGTFGLLKEIQATQFLDMYTLMLDPTARIYTIPVQNPYQVAAPIVKLLRDPRDMCEGGTRYMVQDNKYVYYTGTDIRKTEPIPLGDMVICYDNGKFTCHDTTELSRAFAKDLYINPVTSTRYPSDFIAKIKARYASMEEPSDPEFVPVEEKVVSKDLSKKLLSPEPMKKLPVPPKKKKTGKYTKKILLQGEPFEIYLLFDKDVEIRATDGSKRVIPVIEKASNEDISIVGFGRPPTVSEIKAAVNKAKGDLYIVIADDIAFKDRPSITKRLKGYSSSIKDILYIPKHAEDYDLLLTVQTIVNEYEGGVQPEA